MAPAFFLAAGGLDIPCRLLLRAPNLPLQLKMGCGVHPLVQNRRSYMHTHSWAEIGGVQLSLAAGVHIVFAWQQHRVCKRRAEVFKFPSLMDPQPGSNWGSLGCELYTQPGSNWRPSAC